MTIASYVLIGVIGLDAIALIVLFIISKVKGRKKKNDTDNK